MVNVRKKRCSHDSCTKNPYFNVEGERAVYCRQHAEDDMVDIRTKSCLHDSCTRRSYFDVEGNKTGV